MVIWGSHSLVCGLSFSHCNSLNLGVEGEIMGQAGVGVVGVNSLVTSVCVMWFGVSLSESEPPRSP